MLRRRRVLRRRRLLLARGRRTGPRILPGALQAGCAEGELDEYLDGLDAETAATVRGIYVRALELVPDAERERATACRPCAIAGSRC